MTTPEPPEPADISPQQLASTPAAPPAKWRATIDLIAEYFWLITRYQFITKLPFALVILPLYRMAIGWLITSTGQSALNSSNVKTVLLTPQGLVMALLSVGIVLVATATDITAFILMEGTRLNTGALPNARQTLVATLKTLRFYNHPGTLFILAYLVIVVPLSGVGFSVDLFSRVAVPDFVSDVIANSLTYSLAYIAILIVLMAIGAYGTFIFHVIALEERNPWQGYRRSAAMVRRHLWPILKAVGVTFGLTALGLLVVFVTMMIIAVLFDFVELSTYWSRFWIFFWLFHVIAFLGVVSLYFPPFLLFRLTRLYVHIRTGQTVAKIADWAGLATPSTLPPQAPKPATKTYQKLGGCMAATTLCIAALAVPAIDQLNEVQATPRIPVIAHRAGGNLGPENTIPALEAAINANIPWSEIDVQRTKDGGYIINHDKTFARLSGSSATPQDLTTAEATRLPVENRFTPGQPDGHIDTLEAFLLAAKDRINLFIELKGVSADNQMVDDVVALVNTHQMHDQVVLIGLDADLIGYIEQTYPEFETGFIYFFSVGDIATLPSDYLIMEEAEVSSFRVQEVHAANKKVVVWTINSPDTLDEIAHLPLDGIITDIPTDIQQALTQTTKRFDFEIILDWLFVQR